MKTCEGDVGASTTRMVPLHERWDLVEACAELLNTQWQRSIGARLHGLRQSSNNYPVNLLLLEDEKLIGHARISKVLGSRSLFVESVVVQPELRGKGYGRSLMEGVERYARSRSCTRLCLTTHDKQHFYAHLGFIPSRPVQNVGTLASFMPMELLHKFCRTAETEGDGEREKKRGVASPPPPPTPPPINLQLSKFPSSLVSTSSLSSSSSPSFCPHPLPPPPPPPPPPPSSSSNPPPAPPPPPSSWIPVHQTLEQTPYTDSRGLPIFWMHKDL